MDLVLFLWQATHLQPMEMERIEEVRGPQSRSRSWLWSTPGDRAPSRHVAHPEAQETKLCNLALGKGYDSPALPLENCPHSPLRNPPKTAKLIGSGISSSLLCGASRSRHLFSSGRP